MAATSLRIRRPIQERARGCFPSRGFLQCFESQAVFRIRQCSPEVLSLALPRDALWLEVAQGSIALLPIDRAGGIAGRRELRGMPHEREAITQVAIASGFTRHRPGKE